MGKPWLPLAVAWVILLGLAARENGIVGLLAGLGFVGAFLSGLLGVGGAIVLIPLLLYVPPLAGFAAIDIKTAAGITVAQVSAAALAGLLGHREVLDRRIFLTIGPAMLGASFLGAIASAQLPTAALEAVFAGMATVAAAMLFLFRGRAAPEPTAPLHVNVAAAVTTGVGVGLVAGLLGAGGAFLLIPVLLYGLRIPVRIAVGTSLAVVAFSAVAALLGKALTGQVDWVLASALVAGALPGAGLGSSLSRRTRTDRLVAILALVILAVALRMWIDIASGAL